LQSRASRVFASDIRFDIWKIAWAQFQESPVVGTGAGTFQYYGRLFRPSHITGDPEYVHNDYLQLLSEYGGVGLLLGLVFLGVHVWFGMRALRYLVTERPVARGRLQSDALALNIGALSSVAVYAVHSFLDFNLHIPANALLLAFVFGTLANPGIMMPRITETSERITHYLKLGLPAVGVWVAVSALPTLPAEYFSEQSRVAFREERHADAVSLADIGLAGDPKNPFLHLYRGQALASQAEAMQPTDPAGAKAAFESAVASFQRGRELYPQDQWILVGLGSALDGLGRFAEARPVYEEAIKWNPTSSAIHNYFATHLRLAGRFDEAEAMYKKSNTLLANTGAQHGLELLTKARAAAGTGSVPGAAGTRPNPAQ
jgi:hypothetical protein